MQDLPGAKFLTLSLNSILSSRYGQVYDKRYGPAHSKGSPGRPHRTTGKFKALQTGLKATSYWLNTIKWSKALEQLEE